MKRIAIFIAAAGLLAASCDSFNSVEGVGPMGLFEVELTVSSLVPEVPTVEGLKATFTNTAESFKVERPITWPTLTVEGLLPGIYSVVVSGPPVMGSDGNVYKMSGADNRFVVVKDDTLTLELSGAKESPLLFKEICYTSIKPKTGSAYTFGQFYEIYNNSDLTVDLDGLHFADLGWNMLSSSGPSTLYVPAMDKTKYVYAIRVWKVPGTGSDYPLGPGESFIVVERAQKHDGAVGEPDYRAAEFEFYMPGSSAPTTNYAAPDMTHVYYNGSEAVGTIPQYLTAVTGPGLMLFRVPAGKTFDLQENQVKYSTSFYLAGVPLEWVLDCVEIGPTGSLPAWKRVPSVLDAGIAAFTTSVDNYTGKSISRKVSTETGLNGELRLVDTNDSGEDFELNQTAMWRRYGVGMPSWNHSLQTNP